MRPATCSAQFIRLLRAGDAVVEVMGDERLGGQLPVRLQGTPLARLGEMGPRH